jgi:hypothetical protein
VLIGPFCNSFRDDGPSIPAHILRCISLFLLPVFRWQLVGVFEFEAVEQPIELTAIEDKRSALVKRVQLRSPARIERAALDAHVCERIGVGETSFHVSVEFDPLGSPRH